MSRVEHIAEGFGDDLLARLEQWEDHWPAQEICREAAARIREIEAALAALRGDNQ